MTNDDKSLGDQHTFDGETSGKVDAAADSLGDEMTYAGGANAGPSSLGDEMTFSGVAAGLDDDLVDDDMQITDLEERYTIESVLGKGGMGEVLLATDKRLDRKVAIKRVLGKAARSRKAWQRFENGAKNIAKLNHPNIVQVYEYGRAKDGPFMILECVTGGSLLDRCQQGAIPLEEAIDITCQLCDGIGKAHAAGIVHRDIKPANVLMTEEGIPKLNDFDLAKEQAGDTGMTQEGAVLGTLDFMPPEQRQDAALVDQRSDLWSLAATLYQMVTGEPPRVIDLDTVPQELRSCLAKALKTSKDDRYQSAREFRDGLRASLTAPDQPGAESVDDLGTGECGKCHSRNDSGRKFCNGCGSSLRVNCLFCEQEIPVWEKFCAECGGKQSERIEERKSEVDAKRAKAETLADQSEFDGAITVATEIKKIEDKRWGHQLGWAEQFISETHDEKQRQMEGASRLFEEARKHRSVFDYETAIRALDGIAQPIRQLVKADDDTLDGYYQQLVRNRDELNELMITIKHRVKARDLHGLLEQVDRALELDPNREKLIPLQGQLQKRQAARAKKYDEIHKQATQQLDEGNAKAALRTVSLVKEEEPPRHLKELKQRLTEMVELENELTTLVKEAKADGQIDQYEIDAIFPKAKQYLKMNPNHAAIGNLAHDLGKKASKAAMQAAMQAAARGDTDAQYQLGCMYFQGEGVTEDEAEAVKRFTKAAEQGHVLAQFELGSMYYNGEGVPEDKSKAAKWFTRAAEQGHADAQNVLGSVYELWENMDEEAVKWYTKAAEQGHADAQNNLGCAFQNGWVVAKNYSEAVKWYTKAAEQGNADAQNNVSRAYYYGLGVTRDEDEAVKWYRKAAEQGLANAQDMLGQAFAPWMEFCPDSVTKDPIEAVKWFTKAAEQGFANAQDNLGDAYAKGEGVTKDPIQAAKWWRKGAEQGNYFAQNNLGWAYYHGLGVTRNEDEAVKWYTKSAEQGYAEAKKRLEEMRK